MTDKPAMRSAKDWADGTNVPPQFICAIQQDALTSQRAEPQSVPDGWQLVPKEPTGEILAAMDDVPQTVALSVSTLVGLYKAALAAAPTPPEVKA